MWKVSLLLWPWPHLWGFVHEELAPWLSNVPHAATWEAVVPAWAQSLLVLVLRGGCSSRSRWQPGYINQTYTLTWCSNVWVRVCFICWASMKCSDPNLHDSSIRTTQNLPCFLFNCCPSWSCLERVTSQTDGWVARLPLLMARAMKPSSARMCYCRLFKEG